MVNFVAGLFQLSKAIISYLNTTTITATQDLIKIKINHHRNH